MREDEINLISRTETQDKGGEKMVETEFANLGVDIAGYPEIRARLSLLAQGEKSHFRDAAQMAKMIEVLWPRFGLADISKDKMRLCALLHDVGKSGPAGASAELRQTICRLFAQGSFKNKDVAALTVKEAMLKEGIKDHHAIEEILKREVGIDASEEKMIDFWRRHTEWGYEILNKNQGGAIDEEVALIAGSHHIFQHKNPAHLNLEKSRVLTMVVLAMVDEYQAYRSRGETGHDAAIVKLRQDIAKSHVGKRLVGLAEKVIEILANSEEDLKLIFG